MGIRVENLAEKRPVYVFTTDGDPSLKAIATLQEGECYLVSAGKEVCVLVDPTKNIRHQVSGLSNPKIGGLVDNKKLEIGEGRRYHQISFQGVSEIPKDPRRNL